MVEQDFVLKWLEERIFGEKAYSYSEEARQKMLRLYCEMRNWTKPTIIVR